MTKPKRPWGSGFSSAEVEAARRDKTLLTLELELSRICNINCIYCYAEAGKALPNELTREEIFDVIDQAAELGARRIIVLGGGEPLMHPLVMDAMRRIHSLGVDIDLFTNGMLLTKAMADECFSMRVSPVIKCNSLKDDVQDFLAGQDGASRAIRRGLSLLMEAGWPSEDLPLGVQSVICRQNIDELPAMWIWARDLGLTPYFEMITLQGRAKEHPELAVSIEEQQALFEELARIDKTRYDIHWEPHPPIAGLTCQRHSYTCTVTSTGGVVPCPGVHIPIGDVRKDRLRDILAQSPVIDDLRNLKDRIKDECRDCDLACSCYGCRGMAYQATGDYLAADPLCWRKKP